MLRLVRRFLPFPALAGAALALCACAAQEVRGIHEVAGDFPALTGAYLGQEPPGPEPRLFAPGIVSTALHDDGPPAFSPDGTQVWFRKYAYPHDIVGHMKMENGRWSEPTVFGDFGRYVVGSPRFTPDGKRAFFHSRRPRSGEGEPGDLDIWSAEWTGHDWGDLENIGPPVNTEGDEIIGSVSSDGTIYFMARYEEGLGGPDIYRSRLVDGRYTEPENLGEPVNSPASEASPYVSPDGAYLLFSARGRPDGIGALDLYVSFRAGDGSWSAPVNMGEGVNTEYNDKFPALSPNGKYLFFVSDRREARSFVLSERTYDEMMRINLGPGNGEGDVYWIDAEIIERLRPPTAPVQEVGPPQ